MPEYPRSPFKKVGTSISPKIAGNALDATVIGATTPAAGNFTTGNFTGQLQGNLINNQMVSKATFDILGLMTDPRFLNLQCEDPGAGTMYDVSGQGHDGTYQSSMTSGDKVYKGAGWALDFDGTDDYVDLGNSDDFSFGDGTNDEAATWFGVIEVVPTVSYQSIMSKWSTTDKEWDVALNESEKLVIFQYDKSTLKQIYRYSNDVLSDGWHSYVITSPGDGGATAMNNVKMYIDGALVASTPANEANYVAMENLTTATLIGATTPSAPIRFMQGDNALTGMDGSEWSAYDVHRFHELSKGLYGL